MNILESVIGALVDDLTAYIDANADFRTLRDAANKPEEATSSVANPASASHLTENITSPSVLAFANEPALAPSIFSQVTFSAASILPSQTGLWGFTSLKAQKVTEAEKLKRSLKDLQVNLKGIYESKSVETKIRECLDSINAEIACMSVIRAEHSKPAGKYDALLNVHKKIFEWLKEPAIIELICICLRAEIESKFTTVGSGRLEKKNYSHLSQIPLCKELLNELMQINLQVQFDMARTTEAELLGYKTLMPKECYDEIFEHTSRAMHSLNNFNNLYLISSNHTASAPDEKVRLANLSDVIGNLCNRTETIDAKYSSYIYGSNPSLSSFVATLKSFQVKADSVFNERKKHSANAVISGTPTSDTSASTLRFLG